MPNTANNEPMPFLVEGGPAYSILRGLVQAMAHVYASRTDGAKL